ncbi:MAG: hypothetical protein J1E80_08265 [Desulfovibrionaceae bacterium]|nr:hypothetical protein [Desulfovibrionaceae bacterium]
MDELWAALIRPMTRVLAGLAAGLFVASLIEGLQWTRYLARLAAPLMRQAHLGPVPGAAFALAFFSPSSANALLGEAHAKGSLSAREVMLANLFNSLPSWLTHTPSIFFLTWPVLGFPAVIYTGLTLLAAVLRTLFTMALGGVLLPARPREEAFPLPAAEGSAWKRGLHSAWRRFTRRMPRLIGVAAPIYAAMFFLHKAGAFEAAEQWLAAHVGLLGSLKPESLGIIVLYMGAELGAAVAAAGSLLHSGGLDTHDVVFALLAGNVLSTPLRALRHQLPAYAAYFPPGLAARLVAANQALRAVSILAVAWLYHMAL